MMIFYWLTKPLQCWEERERLKRMTLKAILEEFAKRETWWKELAACELVRRKQPYNELMDVVERDEGGLQRPAAMLLVSLLTLSENHASGPRGAEWRTQRRHMLADISSRYPHLQNIVETGVELLPQHEWDHYYDLMYPS